MTKNMLQRVSRLAIFAAITFTSATVFATQLIQIAPHENGGDIPIQPVTDPNVVPTVTAVPEPTTWAMLMVGAGLLALANFGRKRLMKFSGASAFVAMLMMVTGSAVRADTYVQNFDGIASGLPTGWSVSSNASATSVGNQNATYASTTTSWATTTGNFRNAASATGLMSTDTAATQAASTNRSLAVRQTGSFADPGAAFNFEFSSSGVTVSSISIDLMMLSVQTFSTTFSIQYGIGPNPSTFTTLGSYSDPGTFGTTSFTFTTTDFGANLDNQSDVVFRVVALSAATGSGNRDTVGIDNFSLVASGAISPIAVPEPATIGMMVLGAGLLAGVQRFRRRQG